MSNGVNSNRCKIGCWTIAAIAGLATLVLLMAASSWSFLGALFVAALVFAFLGLVLDWLLCSGRAAEGGALTVAGAGAATAMGAGVASAASTVGDAASTAGAAVADTAAKTADTAKAVASDAVDAAKDAGAKAASATAAVAADAGAAAKNAATSAAETVTDAGAKAADAASDAAAKAADTASDAASAAATAAAKPAKAVKAAAEKPAKAAKAAAEKPAKAAKAAVEDVTPDYDGDGKLEGKDEGTRPAALSGPRGGKADNLKEIKGIGPKLEKLCNSLGFYHFDQIAGWSADEVAWVNANLEGFKGRVTRDQWVEQAKILAAGGETEFSKRVDDGKVY